MVLVDLLSENPIHFSTCRNAVAHSRLGLTKSETRQIAFWHSTAQSLYKLWLNSGEYELPAKQWLLDADGQVNKEGLAIAQSLSRKIPTRLWFFHDPDDPAPTRCPICNSPLNTEIDWGSGFCDACGIQL
jgi:hypothetical protein